MKIKKLTTCAMALVMAFGCGALAACKDDTGNGGNGGNGGTTDAKLEIGGASLIIRGYEWGPMVDAVVLKFDGKVSGVTKDTFTVKTANTDRKVLDAYCSDAKGVKATGETEYVTLELERSSISMYGPAASPFSYSQQTGRNTWAEEYAIALTAAKEVKIGDKTIAAKKKATYKVTKAAERIIPQTESWHKDTIHYTGEGKDITLQRASWAPEGAATDSGKNPLVIWLHGAGEGGTDIDIDLLGNEVTALTTENSTNVQGYFKQDGLAGAYVLAVQTPTMWMDQDGNGTYNHTDAGDGSPQESWYEGALWQAITTYVEGNSDVDTDRIYLGGCSNGGYMTMNMMFHHGDYFAAYYPTCEAYVDGRISDEMIEQIKGYKIWFVLSNDDTTVDPANFEKPTFDRLLKAGAENTYMTLYANVKGKDSPDTTYMGHYSWVYVFNDEVKTRFDNSKVTGVDDLTPANCTETANLWQWLAAQKKGESGGETPTPPPAVEGKEYTFEAEKGILTDGTGVDQDGKPTPITVETGTEWGGDKDTAGPEVTALGYFNSGAVVTFKITSDKKCDAELTLRAASTENETDMWWGGNTFTVKEVDLSAGEHATLAVNGSNVALAGKLPGLSLTGIGWEDMGWIYGAPLKNFGTGTAKIHLVAGENTIVLTALKGFNLDKITIKADATLTWTETDNSSRAPQQA